MDSNFSTRLGPPPYNGQFPMYHPAAFPSPAPNQMPGPPGHAAVPPVGRSSPLHHTASHSPSLGLGIKVAVKPEYKITSPPHLSLHAGDLPWSNFQFDFTLERKILAEAKKESPNWSSFVVENLPNKDSWFKSHCKQLLPCGLANKLSPLLFQIMVRIQRRTGNVRPQKFDKEWGA